MSFSGLCVRSVLSGPRGWRTMQASTQRPQPSCTRLRMAIIGMFFQDGLTGVWPADEIDVSSATPLGNRPTGSGQLLVMALSSLSLRVPLQALPGVTGRSTPTPHCGPSRISPVRPVSIGVSSLMHEGSRPWALSCKTGAKLKIITPKIWKD